MKLGIYTTATPNHSYALSAQARALQSACLYAGVDDPIVCLVCSDDGFADTIETLYENLFPDIQIIKIKNKEWKDCEAGKYYKNPVQLMIAQMRTAGTRALLAAGCDRILSMDSDVLPPHNSIQCMLTMLEFDRGYYQVAACPYPSQGGGAFLGGRGTHRNPILPDHYDDEKDIPEALLKERDGLIKKHDALAEKFKTVRVTPAREKELLGYRKRLDEINEKVKAMPPRANIFSLNGEKWRKRGWFDNAYPAIGKGAVVPTDWVGCGCTMMTKEAAVMCDWSGYNGGGTEDLYICFKRWAANSVRIATISHCPCDHVVRDRNNPEKFIHVQTFHELEGECEGHLRQVNVPWYSQDVGEQFDEGNDGQHTKGADDKVVDEKNVGAKS